MRLIRMHDRRAFPLALITIATAATAAGCASAGSKPAAQATPIQPTTTQALTTTRRPPPSHRFTSQRYSFRVTLPADWSEDDALVAWNGSKLQGLGSAAFANFTDPATGRTLVAAAARAAKGTRLDEWRAAMVRAAPPISTESSSARQTTLGGEPALAWTATASDGYHVHKLAALHRTRGYMLFLASPTADDDAENRSIFESIRRSFRFTQ
jgi:hypothetical protein